MGIFLFLYFLLVILVIINKRNDRVGTIVLTCMALFNAFRGYYVGSDTKNYYRNQFYGEFSLDFSSSYELEWIFQSISAFIRDSGLDSRWCLYSLSIITYIFLYLSYKRYNKQLGTSLILILLFYFVFDFYSISFNIARQCTAVSILLYAYSFLYSDKRQFFFIYVILASGFHVSSILFAFLYLIRNFNISKFKDKELICLSYVFLILVFIGKIYIWDIIVSSFPIFSIYEALMDDTEIGSFSILSLFLEAFRLSLGLYVFIRLRELRQDKYNTLLYLGLLAVILMDSFYGNVTRIFYGISIIRVISFATLFSHRRLSKNDKIVFVISVFFYGLFTLSSLNNGAYEIVPYEFDLL